MSFDLVLANANSVLPTEPQALGTSPLVQEVVHIGIKNGKIAEISKTPLSGNELIDCTGLSVLPGVIDSQVHFREPGMTHKEDLESGTRGAAMGDPILVGGNHQVLSSEREVFGQPPFLRRPFWILGLAKATSRSCELYSNDSLRAALTTWRSVAPDPGRSGWSGAAFGPEGLHPRAICRMKALPPDLAANGNEAGRRGRRRAVGSDNR